ncbi:MAG: peptidase domain-containing ABC transporter, partial [Acidobacteriota bacterium]
MSDHERGDAPGPSLGDDSGGPRGGESRPLIERFPGLGKLKLGGKRSIPYIRQTSNADCGAACLTMVLAWHGKHVALDEVRQVAGVDRDGSDAYSLLRAGRYYGLSGRGVKIEQVEDLEALPSGAILHWRFHHFVVFERLVGDDVRVLDPALGRRAIPREEFSRSFTGIGLTLEPTEEFLPEEKRATGIWRYLRRVFQSGGELPRLVAVSVFLQLLALAVPLLTGTLVDRVVPQGDDRLLLLLAAGTAVIAVYRFFCSFLRSHLLLQLRTRLDAVLTLEFLDHMVALPYSFVTQRSTGDLVTRMNSNTMVREILTSSTLSALLDGILVSLYLVLLLLVSPTLGGLVVLLGLLRVLIFVVTRGRYRDLMTEQLQVQATARGYQMQMLSGIETLKASGAENRAVGHWSDLFVDELNVNLEQGRLQAKIDASLDVLTAISPLIVLLVGGHLVLGGSLTLGTMLAMNALATGFLLPLSTLMATAFDIQRLASYLDRISEVFETDKEQDLQKVSPPGQLTGRVRVEEASFRYGPLAPLVIKEMSLEIRAGEFVGIVGRSGSGKSTLASLLFGLYPPTDGRVYYDDADIQRLDLQAVRQQIGIVTQQTFLFGASVRRNIALSEPEAPLSRVIEAARKAEIHADISAMPMGYTTVLADGGASLSGGQRQRLALARALFHRPR